MTDMVINMIHNFNSTSYVFVLLFCLVGFGVPNDSLAQFSCIDIQTDKSSYQTNEIIFVHGSVCKYVSGAAVSIKVTDPDENIIHIDQIDIRYSDFSTSISTGGALWKKPGTYHIYAQYGDADTNGETFFTILGGPVIPKQSSISVEGTSFFVSYNIIGGKIFTITPDINTNLLIIAIESVNDGQLTITLPRTLIDAQLTNGDDDTFFVLIDGKESDFDETTTGTDRTLTIAFEEGVEEIEIIGTQVFPGGGMESYYDTYLTLQVDDAYDGVAVIYPQLTDITGVEINTDNIKISVDGKYDRNVSSNQKSWITTGAGLHTIRADVDEFYFTSDPSIVYRSSNDEVSRTISGSQPPDGSIAIVVLVIVGAVGVGVGIALSKRKKKLPAIQTPYVKSSPTPIKPDDTQFWVCPHCGKDTEAYYGKQYCRNCNVYL